MAFLSVVVLAIAWLLLFTGCAGGPLPVGSLVSTNQEENLRNLSDAVHEAAATGTEVGLYENPGTRPYFVAALAHLDALIEAKNFDPAELKAALNKLPIKELKSPVARIVINRGISVYRRYAERIDIDRQVYVASTIRALRDGIQEGLDGWPAE
jgi:hypothetical protein